MGDPLVVKPFAVADDLPKPRNRQTALLAAVTVLHTHTRWLSGRYLFNGQAINNVFRTRFVDKLMRACLKLTKWCPRFVAKVSS